MVNWELDQTNSMWLARVVNFCLFLAGAVVVFLEIGHEGRALYVAGVLVFVTLGAEIAMEAIEARPVPPSETTARPKGFPIEPKETK
jgi:hypothetical protein